MYPIVRVAEGVARDVPLRLRRPTLEPVADIDDPAVQRLLEPAALTLADGKHGPGCCSCWPPVSGG